LERRWIFLLATRRALVILPEQWQHAITTAGELPLTGKGRPGTNICGANEEFVTRLENAKVINPIIRRERKPYPLAQLGRGLQTGLDIGSPIAVRGF